MQKLKRLLVVLSLVVATWGAVEAQASTVAPHGGHYHGHYRRPFIYNGVYSGYNYAYGWYPIVNGYWNWPGYRPAYFLNPYGYTYYSYFQFQPMYQTFGAIAYSPSTGRYGFAYKAMNQGVAVQSAINFCGANDCTGVVWVQGGCAAIAKGESGIENSAVAWGYDANRYRARNYATNACRNAGHSNCKVLAWTCSY